MNKEQLIAFEQEVANSFNRGEIKYPVHLDNGNEDELIRIFRKVRGQDWVFGSWRMHYKALLKGVPPEKLNDAIRKGESMALYFPEYKVYGSAIVGGTISIALGVALSIQKRFSDEVVWCFLGDMTGHCGIFHECKEYAANFRLPINWVIEDNGLSVCTSTEKAWGNKTRATYSYQSKYPHCGSGVRVNF